MEVKFKTRHLFLTTRPLPDRSSLSPSVFPSLPKLLSSTFSTPTLEVACQIECTAADIVSGIERGFVRQTQRSGLCADLVVKSS